MALKSDNLGFLVGTPTDIGNAIAIWNDIRKDTSAIYSLIKASSASAKKPAAIPAGRTQQSNVITLARKVQTPSIENRNVRSARPVISTEVASNDAAFQRRMAGVERERDASGRFTSSRNTQSNQEQGAKTIVKAIDEQTRSAKKMTEISNRGANGRFMKGDEGLDAAGKLGGVKRLASSIQVAGSALVSQDIDPSIAAAQELSAIVSPLKSVITPIGRGMGRMFGKGRGQGGDDAALRVEKRKVSWMERIFGLISESKDADEKHAAQQQKQLAELGNRTGGKVSDSGGLGGLLALLAGLIKLFSGFVKTLLSFSKPLTILRSLPLLGRLMPSIGAAGGIPSVNVPSTGGIGAPPSKPNARGGRLAKMGGFMKRIPVLGALLTMGAFASDAYATEHSDLSESEKTDQHVKNTSKTVGGLGGMAAGAAAGAAAGSIVPVVGTAIGGLVGAWLGSGAGEILGDKVGGWINDLRKSNFVKDMGKKWDSMTTSISVTWSDGVSRMENAWKDFKGMASETAQDAQKWAKDKMEDVKNSDAYKALERWAGNAAEMTGNAKKVVSEKVDAGKAYVGEKVEAVKAAVAPVVEEVVKKVEPVVAATKEAASNAANAMANTRAGRVAKEVSSQAVTGAHAVKDWFLGKTSKKYESAKGGAATISSGKGDNGGISYGTYQLSTKMGMADKFISQSKYAESFKGLKAGTKEFGEKWKEIAKSSPNFEKDQYDFIKRTHFNPAMQGLMKDGIDLAGRGDAILDMLWSTSVQFGHAGAQRLIKNSLPKSGIEGLSDAEIIKAVQEYKVRNNESLFEKSDAKNRLGTLNRAREEEKSLLQLAGAPKLTAAASTDNALPASIKMPAIPKAIPEMPLIQTPLNRIDKVEPIKVSVEVDRGDVRQDVRDRSIAHIATGGVSGFNQ